jgi:L-ascorbate metabolism protein UlaG (beta-lactamase superfamily)
MKITWYGHAAFLIEGQGKRIIMDPFSPESGYDPIDEQADILTMSQDDDRFHSHSDGVTGNPQIVVGRSMPDEGVTVDGIHFRAVKVWEDLARTKNLNGMIYFTIEGVSVAHMGDIGHPLSDDEVAPLKGVDVLLAITGNHHTIAIDALVDAIDRIRPRVVIPMHFLTPKLRLNIHTNDEFLSKYQPDQIEHRSSSSLELTPENLPSELRIIVLQYAR